MALADGGTNRRALTPRLGDLLSVFSIIGTLCYGVGWLYYNALFSEVNLEPEDVGIGLEFLLVRAGLAIGAVVTLLAVLLVVTGAAARLTGPARSSSAVTQLWLMAAGIIFCAITWSLLFTTLYLEFDLLSRWWAAGVAFVGAVILSAVAAALTLVGLGYGLTGTGTGLAEPLSPAHLLAVSGIAVLMMLGGTYLAGRQLGNEIANGRPVRGYVLTLRYVTVHALADGTGIDGACLLRLGSKAGVEVLYDPDPDQRQIHTVSSENIVLSSYFDRC